MQDNFELQERLTGELERVELRFNHAMARLSLWGMVFLPLVPGTLTLASIVSNFPQQLHIHIGLAWAIGLVTMAGIELLGLVAIRLALRMRKFNRRAKGYHVEPAPVAQGYTAALLYVAVVGIVTFLLKINPALSIWALLPMALLGALADWVFALSGDQNEREHELRKLIKRAEESAQRDRTLDQLRDEVDQLRGVISCAKTDHHSRVQDMQAHIHAQEEVISSLRDQLRSQSDQIDQLCEEIDQMESAQTAQPIAQVITLPADQKVYKNGHIADDIEHLELHEQIRVVAQRQLESIGKVNKSAIARTLNCSPNTVRAALVD
ncbi:MAG: hypothetical protein KDE19_15325 [Caldilineaceae bacterium]|nr:hypothetical protein [Caldilineaceae bacterium]